MADHQRSRQILWKDATPIVEHTAYHYDIKTVDLDISKLSKGGFDHFMLKDCMSDIIR